MHGFSWDRSLLTPSFSITIRAFQKRIYIRFVFELPEGRMEDILLKHIYRGIILIVVFIAALFYFSRDIKEVVFDFDNTIAMEETTLPLVTIKTGNDTINLLQGYTSNLDANKIRESVTPIGTDQSLEVLIQQENYEIKKLNYELREFVGNSMIEDNSISVFEDERDYRSAKLKLKAELIPDKEYALKITLVTSESEKIYYYQRIKINENTHLSEKVNFVMDFHKAIMNKETAKSIERYLESSGNTDNTSLSYVTINSSLDLVGWGKLEPKILSQVVPTIKEIYQDTASIELNYTIWAEVSGVTETYQVSEFYRVRYATDRMYLLNYERHMEALFDASLVSVSQNELKLGITTDLEVPNIISEDNTKFAFIRNKELWFYDLENNEMTKVFSFREKNSDYIRDINEQHNIQILNMDVEGNIDFLVYGYMNRGQYEGKVAIVLYRFIRGENRIEEQVYIPVDEPYQTLKENLGELLYINTAQIFYFQLNDAIYSYNLVTKKLTEMAKDIGKDQVMVLKDIHSVVWQENADPKKSNDIYLLNMETGRLETISSEKGYHIRLMGMIDSNIIYGYVKEENVTSMMDGSILAPLSKVEIASADSTVLKSYYEPDYYISGIVVKDNIVELRRVKKIIENGRGYYSLAEPDYIMNQEKSENTKLSITKRITDQALTEYYMTLPQGFIMEEKPRLLATVNTVISEDPTVRLPETERTSLCYYPYITGGIAGSYSNASDAIAVADQRAGVVLNNKNQIVWERGIKSSQKLITKLDDMNIIATNSTVESCLWLMLSYQGITLTKDQVSTNNSSAYEVLKKYSKHTPIRLTGITLEEALYFISKDIPVLAMTDTNSAVIIYGYDTYNITIYDPANKTHVKRGLQDSKQMFENAGNVFLSYLE